MATPHDLAHLIPFPQLPISLHCRATGRDTSITLAYLDTGADMSLAPVALLQSIGADVAYNTRIRSHWGEPRPINIFYVDIDVGEEHLTQVEIGGDTVGNEIYLGRNILNKLYVLLDGPHLQTEVLTRRPMQF